MLGTSALGQDPDDVRPIETDTSRTDKETLSSGSSSTMSTAETPKGEEANSCELEIFPNVGIGLQDYYLAL